MENLADCIIRVCCFVAYFRSRVSVLVEYWLMTLHCFVFGMLFCIIVVLEMMSTLEGVSFLICWISACFFFVGVACVAGSIVAILF